MVTKTKTDSDKDNKQNGKNEESGRPQIKLRRTVETSQRWQSFTRGGRSRMVEVEIKRRRGFKGDKKKTLADEEAEQNKVPYRKQLEEELPDSTETHDTRRGSKEERKRRPQQRSQSVRVRGN